ncbi:LacI family DNA-binding transcriptional regulator [Nakamurella endophytica]|uniref:LacI family transcriptional regulator n=1 Tax=Nakamurella endophytica TaxID=1748367 RepID=A0A917T587_9ACTN|nr:LacI family DNA-binding transcriptional regulator [Nakamurella endophytica]GGM10858.1 LacI family transcriptional regulator [Nakamurella endophytica]
MTPRATVYDVARAAGVSIKTVSRVVNGSDEVSKETRERVMTAVADLDYVRNPIARSLRTGSSDTIGVVVDSIADPFFASLVSVVEQLALAQDVSVLIASTGRSVSREKGQVLRLLQQNVGALLLAPNGHDHRYLLDAAPGMPIVLVDRGWELPGFDTVGVEDEDGGLRATRHLLAHGHRRIAFLGESPELTTIVHRQQGYLRALAEAGLAPAPELVRTDCSVAAAAAEATEQLLRLPQPPTAIFSSNPRASLGVVSALHRADRLDVALVSFGDFDLADALRPAVTVVDQDPGPLAQAAAVRVLARMRGQRLPPEDIVLPLQLVERGSGELRP